MTLEQIGLTTDTTATKLVMMAENTRLRVIISKQIINHLQVRTVFSNMLNFDILHLTGTPAKVAPNPRESPHTEKHQVAEVKKESDVDLRMSDQTEIKEIPFTIQTNKTSNLALLYGISHSLELGK